MKYQDFIDQLCKDIPGYHFEINVYPIGGFIDAVGCEECGTVEGVSYSEGWSYRKDNGSIDNAIEALKRCIDISES